MQFINKSTYCHGTGRICICLNGILQEVLDCVCCFWRDSPQWAMASSFTRFLDQTQRRTTVGRTPLDEWSSRHRDLYLTTHNTHNRQTSMPPGIRTHNLSRRTAADLRLWPRGLSDRSCLMFFSYFIELISSPTPVTCSKNGNFLNAKINGYFADRYCAREWS